MLLQTFVAVARAGKMTQAAHELALTPGAVSQRIRQLEEAAGRRLFLRNPSGGPLSTQSGRRIASSQVCRSRARWRQGPRRALEIPHPPGDLERMEAV